MVLSENKTSNNCIDLIKFFMAIFVISIHTLPLVNCTNSVLLTINELLVRMAVPFFFLSSGYLLSAKFHDSQTDATVSILTKYLLKITRMYLIWSVVYLPLAIYHYYTQNASALPAIRSYVSKLVFVGEHYNSWHLWYLLSTIYALVFILLLIRVNVSPKGMLIFSALFSVISIGVDYLMSYSGDLPRIASLTKTAISLTISNNRIFQGMIYIPIGIYIYTIRQKLHFQYCAIGFLLSFVCNYFIENSVISNYLLIFASIALFGMVLNIKLKDHAIYPILRKLSTSMYHIHMYIWTFYYFIVYGKKQYGVDSFIVTTILSLIIGFLYLIYKKSKFSKISRKVAV